MVFDLGAWAVLLLVASTVGSGALALLRAHDIRAGDRLLLGAWVGVVVLASALLAASLVTPLTPGVSLAVAATVSALGVFASWRAGQRPTAILAWKDAPRPRSAITIGLVALLVGAAALASDPVTLYDSLVYHVGVIRWLREVGTVPGVALIHNRLGHVSAWFTLAAGFDAGPLAGRASNVPFGLALVLVGLQASIAVARILANCARVSDWFLMLTSGALVWAAVAHDTATPSPDVPGNALIVVAAWAVLVVGEVDSRGGRQTGALVGDGADAIGSLRPLPNASIGLRLLPLVIAIGACTMKLFAVPAVVATASYVVFARPFDGGGRAFVRRTAVCVTIGIALLGPFIAANIMASGCPAYPSPLGCTDAPWSVGLARAADYATYVRDVARWERRGVTSVGASTGWIVPWILAHPYVTALVMLSAALTPGLLRRVRGSVTSEGVGVEASAVRTLVAFALLGIAFAAWQAPAPRFFYAFVLIVPSLTLGLSFDSFVKTRPVPGPRGVAAWSAGFVFTSALVGFAYTLASQKLNVRSALTSGARLAPVRKSDLLLPSPPEAPQRLFRWRVNDVDLYTPVPRPIADTLGYHSVIGFNTAFEKCSTAPLPCTPYLPDQNIELRQPAKGLRGGFVRVVEPSLARRAASCVGELSWTGAVATTVGRVSAADLAGQCGEPAAR